MGARAYAAMGAGREARQAAPATALASPVPVTDMPATAIPVTAMPASAVRLPGALPVPRSGCACGGGCPACARRAAARGPAVAAASGSPLDPVLRKRAEVRFGVDLSDLQVSERGPLAQLARARGADAAASGGRIGLARPLMKPGSLRARLTLGHEISHIAHARGAAALASSEEAHADLGARSLGAGLSRRPGEGQLAPAQLNGASVHFGIFDPLLDFAEAPLDYARAALPGLKSAARQVLAALPENRRRLLLSVLDAGSATRQWDRDLARLLTDWQGPGPVFDHLIRGVVQGLTSSGEILGAMIDVIGVDAFARSLFVTSGALERLDAAAIAASRRVHPPGMVPYGRVMVDRGGVLSRLAALEEGAPILGQLKGGDSARYRGIAIMNVIGAPPGGMSGALAVHELTHVGQYRLSGGRYMAQALHAQLAGQGYDYTLRDGSLAASITAGRRFFDFNREQQAQICADYYTLCQDGDSLLITATRAELEHFIRDLWASQSAAWPAGGP